MQVMTVNEYAKHLHSSISTIRNMCRQGVLPAVKVGLKWIIDVETADEYIHTRCCERSSQMALKRVKMPLKKPKKRVNTGYMDELARLRGAVYG